MGVGKGLFAPVVCSAQQGAFISPEVHADRRVTFRLRATNATSVAVSGQFQRGPVPLERGSNGVWAVTVGPVTPSVYEYSFNVDGVSMIDPGNHAIKPMRNPRTSILEVPGEPPLIHDFQNVPDGTVHMHWYPSKSLGIRRALQVYTPPGYERSRTRYPMARETTKPRGWPTGMSHGWLTVRDRHSPLPTGLIRLLPQGGGTSGRVRKNRALMRERGQSGFA